MHTYYYQPPHTKGSSKQMTVYNENSSPIGTIERHFKTLFHKILDTLLGQNNLIVNIQAKDAAEIGRASCRERVEIWVGAGPVKTRKRRSTAQRQDRCRR